MIKHLGEALLPFRDCGFQRHPEHPLPGEDVRVEVRLDDLPGHPTLLWRVDGQTRPDLAGAPLGDRRYAFSLGEFDAPCRVEYAISAGGETLGGFSFDVLSC